MADIAGSDYMQGFHIDNKSRSLNVSESIIDGRSIIKAKGLNVGQYKYLNLAGVGKQDAVYRYVNRGRYDEVILSLDNDTSGRNAVHNITNTIKKEKLSIK